MALANRPYFRSSVCLIPTGGNYWIHSDQVEDLSLYLRRAERRSVGRDAADKLGVAKCKYSRYDPAVAFAEEVGL